MKYKKMLAFSLFILYLCLCKKSVPKFGIFLLRFLQVAIGQNIIAEAAIHAAVAHQGQR